MGDLALKDPLGARMKDCYEHPYRSVLARRSYAIVRVDGKNFSNYTRGLGRPYDLGLLNAMGSTMEALCAELGGCELAFQQSDEISFLLTDFANPETQPWFGGNVQKIASVAASLATAHFNRLCTHPIKPSTLALFDARAFSIPNGSEVANYFFWRQSDCQRNAISMIGQAHFSVRELQGVSTRELKQKLLDERSVDVASFPDFFLNGQVCERTTILKPVSYIDKRTQLIVTSEEPVERRIWERGAAPVFRGNFEWLGERIPVHPNEPCFVEQIV